MSEYTLLTGATGLLGRYLLRDLLRTGRRLAVVVRAASRESAIHRVEAILQRWDRELGAPLPRPVCFSGDLTQPYLGLDDAARQWLAENCGDLLHNAASLEFNEDPSGEPWRSNVTGTQHVLDLCRDANIRRLHYVSTAYVCGLRHDRVLEDDLDRGQQFRNDYERSKFQAEQLVRGDLSLEQLTVYRPVVIAGDSQTGYTSTYHGLYMYLQIMSILARNTPPGPDGVRNTEVDLHLTGDEQRNVIPVDWTSAVIAHLLQSPEAHGRTFHLAPRQRMTPRDMINAGYSYFNSRGVRFVGHEPISCDPTDRLKRHAYENSDMYRDYEVDDPKFDTSNLDRFAGHLPCPSIDEPMLHRFLAYGERDRWGRRRERPATEPFSVGAYLAQVHNAATAPLRAVHPARKLSIGLDICGAGGGQWTIVFWGRQTAAVEIGIRAQADALLTMSAAHFVQLLWEGQAQTIPGELWERLTYRSPEIAAAAVRRLTSELFTRPAAARVSREQFAMGRYDDAS